LAEKKAPLTRSQMMARVRSADTKPELVLRKALHASGYRFRLHVRSLPGCPDIVMRKHRCAVFVHGCFWHGHEGCRFFRIPKTRPEFWSAKIVANRDRDRRSIEALLGADWRVLVVWECATRSFQPDNLVRLVAEWLQGTETSAELSSDGMSTDRTVRSGISSGEQEPDR
jgi:DNA mismatch endonuclease (patch repair protein)